jgi:glycerol-3-phosphate acyltransferase PlsY
MEILKIIGIYVLSYFIGSIPFSQILTSLLAPGKKLQNEGTGHVGGSNAYLTAGPFAGILATILDMSKPVMAMLAAYFLLGWNFRDDLWIMLLITVFVKAGHDFPVWLKFKGGKGLSTASGAMLFFGPWYWLAVHSLNILTLFQKNKNKGLKLGNLIMIAIIPMEGILWLLEMYIPWGSFGFKLSNYFGPVISNTWPLFWYSWVWAILYFFRRLYGCGLMVDIKQGISPWRAIMLRGIFETYPRESKYRNPGKDIQMGEDD